MDAEKKQLERIIRGQEILFSGQGFMTRTLSKLFNEYEDGTGKANNLERALRIQQLITADYALCHSHVRSYLMSQFSVILFLQDLIKGGPKTEAYKLYNEKFGAMMKDSTFTYNMFFTEFGRDCVIARQMMMLRLEPSAGIEDIEKLMTTTGAVEQTTIKELIERIRMNEQRITALATENATLKQQIANSGQFTTQPIDPAKIKLQGILQDMLTDIKAKGDTDGEKKITSKGTKGLDEDEEDTSDSDNPEKEKQIEGEDVENKEEKDEDKDGGEAEEDIKEEEEEEEEEEEDVKPDGE